MICFFSKVPVKLARKLVIHCFIHIKSCLAMKRCAYRSILKSEGSSAHCTECTCTFKVCKTKDVAVWLVLQLNTEQENQLLEHFKLGKLKILLGFMPINGVKVIVGLQSVSA